MAVLGQTGGGILGEPVGEIAVGCEMLIQMRF